jgi:glycerol-3-phosphate acyltransferase PlsY
MRALPLTALVAILASYILGCFSTGYYLVRLRAKQDIRQSGSGSAGGTNVGRLLGRGGFALTMAGDTVKGAAAMGLALWLGVAEWAVALVMLAVVAGHIFPAQLGFRGGRGLSPALGCLLVYDFRLVLAVGVLAALVGLATRQYTLGLMVVIVLAPPLALWLGHVPAIAWGLAAMVPLLWFAHRNNVRAAIARLRGQAGGPR